MVKKLHSQFYKILRLLLLGKAKNKTKQNIPKKPERKTKKKQLHLEVFPKTSPQSSLQIRLLTGSQFRKNGEIFWPYRPANLCKVSRHMHPLENAEEREPGLVHKQELTAAHQAVWCPAGRRPHKAASAEALGKLTMLKPGFPPPPAFRSGLPQSRADIPETRCTGASQTPCELLESHPYATACAQQNGSLGAEQWRNTNKEKSCKDKGPSGFHRM